MIQRSGQNQNLLLKEDVEFNEKFINTTKTYSVQSKQEITGKIVSLTAKYLELERQVGEAQKENEVTLEDYEKPKKNTRQIESEYKSKS